MNARPCQTGTQVSPSSRGNTTAGGSPPANSAGPGPGRMAARHPADAGRRLAERGEAGYGIPELARQSAVPEWPDGCGDASTGSRRTSPATGCRGRIETAPTAIRLAEVPEMLQPEPAVTEDRFAAVLARRRSIRISGPPVRHGGRGCRHAGVSKFCRLGDAGLHGQAPGFAGRTPVRCIPARVSGDAVGRHRLRLPARRFSNTQPWRCGGSPRRRLEPGASPTTQPWRCGGSPPLAPASGASQHSRGDAVGRHRLRLRPGASPTHSRGDAVAATAGAGQALPARVRHRPGGRTPAYLRPVRRWPGPAGADGPQRRRIAVNARQIVCLTPSARSTRPHNAAVSGTETGAFLAQ